jgi:hypothetical protein
LYDGVVVGERGYVRIVVFERFVLVRVVVLVFGPFEVVFVSLCLGCVPSVVSIFPFRLLECLPIGLALGHFVVSVFESLGLGFPLGSGPVLVVDVFGQLYVLPVSVFAGIGFGWCVVVVIGLVLIGLAVVRVRVVLVVAVVVVTVVGVLVRVVVVAWVLVVVGHAGRADPVTGRVSPRANGLAGLAREVFEIK